MDRVIALGAIVALSLLGFVRLMREFRHLGHERQFTSEFMQKLGSYLQSQGKDQETYSWLIHRSPRMQENLGYLGVVHAYRPPYENLVYKNFQIVLNVLPQIRREFDEDYALRDNRLVREYGASLQETFLRYLGVLDDQRDSARKNLWNPISWFREGIQSVVLLPLSFLSWIGVVGESTIARVAGSAFFRFVSGIIALLGLLSTAVTIVTGWVPFVAIVRHLLGIP